MLPIAARTIESVDDHDGRLVPALPSPLALPIASRASTSTVDGQFQAASAVPSAFTLPIASRASTSTADGQPQVDHPGAGPRLQRTLSSAGNRLLDHYVLREVLGQGSFGIVYACCNLFSSEERAVKMVDKVETPVDEIKREAEVQKKLKHPNIVKVHHVYFERCFVCIVMDICRGGDLIEGIESHWDRRGNIACQEVRHVTKQMASAVAFLHSQSIAHRDVKGDNYLLDREDLVDPHCRVLLTDFGAARELAAEERMTSMVGTRSHWAPEVFKHDYGLKVDVWALGVVVFGLYESRLPFSGEQEIKEKAVKLSAGTPAKCADFVQSLLLKDESERVGADRILEHPWLLSTPRGLAEEELEEAARVRKASSFTTSPTSDASTPTKEVLREEGAHPIVHERRCELVTRMRTAARMKRTTNAPAAAGRIRQAQRLWEDACFEVFNPRTQCKHTFQWWPANRAKDEEVAHVHGSKNTRAGSEPQQFDISTDKFSPLQLVAQMLENYGVDFDCWGKDEAKTLEEFVDELQKGKARLMLDATEHKKLVRVVDLVMIRIISTNGDEDRFLVECGQTFADGRQVNNLNRLPGAKRESHENTRQTVARIVAKQLNLDSSSVIFDFRDTDVFEKEMESRSYPGVTTVYRTEIVSGCASELPDTGGIDYECTFKTSRSFEWWTAQECDANGVCLSAPNDEDEFSGLVPAPVAFDQQALKAHLESNRIDVSKFGRRNTKTVDDLAVELIKGEGSLMQQPDGRIIRVVDVVVLNLWKGDSDDVLVEVSRTLPDGQEVSTKVLPSDKRRQDENQFLCAQRIVTNLLMVDENSVSFDKDEIDEVQELADSRSYPGLRTLYRKRVISGRVQPPTDEENDDLVNLRCSMARSRHASSWATSGTKEKTEEEATDIKDGTPQDPQQPMTPQEQLLARLFQSLDAEGSGVIFRGELLKVLQSFATAGEAMELTVDHCFDSLNHSDATGLDSSLVQLDEFSQALLPLEDIFGYRKFAHIIDAWIHDLGRKDSSLLFPRANQMQQCMCSKCQNLRGTLL